MEKTKQAVFGLFQSRSGLETASDQLRGRGFPAGDISVLFKDSSQKLAHENATKAPEGATTGAVSGLALGGAFGWLVGIGSLAIPGVGPLIAAGPIMAALAGAGVGAALGGVTGGLVGFGIPEYEAKRYATFINEGGYLISVHVDDADRQKMAKEILEAAGAESISTKSEEAESKSRDRNPPPTSSTKSTPEMNPPII